MMSILLIDGYVDEPTCLGVPPYISPYPRYIAGAIWDADHSIHIVYKTIDQLRNDTYNISKFNCYDCIIVIAGAIVPGRYLAGFPVSFRELQYFFKGLTKTVTILCGPSARYGFGVGGGRATKGLDLLSEIFDMIITGDPEIVIHQLIKSNFAVNAIVESDCRHNPSDIRNFAVRGSQIITQHPYFPDYLIAEIETYRGCSRSIVGGCSFCAESLKGSPQFRPYNDIIAEIHGLYSTGLFHYRLGNQPCFFSYQAHDAEKQEFPRPNPEAIEKLLKGIREVAPDIKTLHIDNANPGVLARYPEESTRIAQLIIKYHTAGDVAALGVESVDTRVITDNNLKASPEEVMQAIRLLNKIGSQRGKNGLPELLPGLNFVFGLKSESKRTYRLTLEFLQQLVEINLLVRRINLRQVLPLPGTRIELSGIRTMKRNHALFQHLKKQIQTTVEKPLLQRLVPLGTVLTDVYTEVYDGHLTFARQLGSYPLLVGIPGNIPLHQFLSVMIIGHGYRSVTAVPFPLDINAIPKETLEALPGIGKKRATRIMNARPITSYSMLLQVLDDISVVSALLPFLPQDLRH
ncbi:MAG: radical SAM protein [Candidatus Thermoplasmatota archaeon]|nr:radical SAM protein [Candidatus Thermoplasmatota archaeon]MBU1941368.1 radical SAM protein [Candidatus Thermoplasmatota archaeon]